MPTPPAAPIQQTAKSEINVEFASGKLVVDATNASLNQVLREVAQKTGLKISGGVADERVFGHYGPSSTTELLTSLLDGTGTNILLVDGEQGPSQLILSARRGGVTPPNPNASRDQDDQPDPQQQYVPPFRAYQPPVATGRGPVGANSDGSPAFGPNGPEGVDPNQANPQPGDQPRTPQQVFEQLQSLSKQQPGAPPQ